MLRELFNNFLEAIAALLAVIAFLCTTKHWRHARHLQTLFVYFLLTFLNLGIASWLAFINKPNIIWYNINGFTSLVTLSLFFYHILQSKRLKTLVILLSSAGLLFYLALLALWDDNFTFNSAGYSIYLLLIIFYGFLFLKEVFSLHEAPSVESDGILWIVSGLLTYFMGAYVIQVTYKLATIRFLRGENIGISLPGVLWGVHNVIYCLASAFIAYHLIKMRHELVLEKV